MTIAERIKKLRCDSDISQAELARRLGVTRSSVNAWELGISMPTIQYVIEMARLWHVTSDYLLGLSNRQSLSLSGLGDEERKLLYSMLNYFKTHGTRKQEPEPVREKTNSDSSEKLPRSQSSCGGELFHKAYCF